MNTQLIVAGIAAVSDTIAAHESEIEGLDRAIGDGDHIINVKRGCSVLMSLRPQLADLEPAEALKKIGMSLMSTVGGASGPLLASFFLAGAKEADSDGAQPFARIFAAGVDAIRERGKADVGEKTMLDVLIPVARLLLRLAEEQASLAAMCEHAKAEAQRGMLATRDMIATKGRAYFLGERSLGHIDPGARTAQLAVCAVCDMLLVQQPA
jgi:dihydroxyacetone kinase-like protein